MHFEPRFDIFSDLNELKLTVDRIEKKLDEWIGKLSISVNTPKESTSTCKKPEPSKASSSAADDDDVDLFGSESEVSVLNLKAKHEYTNGEKFPSTQQLEYSSEK